MDKYFNINSLNFLADQTKIVLSNIKLNKNFEVNNFEKIKIKTYQNKIKNNDFLIQKSKRIVISGYVLICLSNRCLDINILYIWLG